MCCAIFALTMTLLTGWRSLASPLGGRAARLRRVAVATIAIGVAAGSAMAADRFAMAGGEQSSWVMRLSSMPICGHVVR
jgi:hypothetical protein